MYKILYNMYFYKFMKENRKKIQIGQVEIS